MAASSSILPRPEIMLPHLRDGTVNRPVARQFPPFNRIVGASRVEPERFGMGARQYPHWDGAPACMRVMVLHFLVKGELVGISHNAPIQAPVVHENSRAHQSLPLGVPLLRHRGLLPR